MTNETHTIEYPLGIIARIHPDGVSVTGYEQWENETQAAGYAAILDTVARALQAGADYRALYRPIAEMVKSLRNCGIAMS